MRVVSILKPSERNAGIAAEILALGMVGKHGRASGYGRSTFGVGRAGDRSRMGGIYQRRALAKNPTPVEGTNAEPLPYIVMRNYAPTNPQTTAQQANRAKFADAMTAWQSLTDDEKLIYHKQGSRIGLTGHNVFIRGYMASH